MQHFSADLHLLRDVWYGFILGLKRHIRLIILQARGSGCAAALPHLHKPACGRVPLVCRAVVVNKRLLLRRRRRLSSFISLRCSCRVSMDASKLLCRMVSKRWYGSSIAFDEACL
jgi:hypothetical protein